MAHRSVTDRTADQYNQEVFNIVKSGYVTFGISLGNELGLFKAMDELGKPATADEIAKKSSCKARYVREWALQMSMARVLEMDGTGTLFRFPEGGLQALTRLLPFSLMLPRLALNHQDLLRVFPKAGPRDGFKTAKWGKMFTADASLQMREVVSAMEKGAHVLDVGCSAGDCCITLGGQFPRSSYYGVDVVESVILEAQEKTLDHNVNNVHFEVQDAASFPLSWSDKFDVVFLFDVLHDIPQASKAAKEAFRILKKGGRCMVSENLLPSNPKEQREFPEAAIYYTFSLYQCLPISMNQDDSEALGYAVGSDKLKDIMMAAGFQLESMWLKPCPPSADRMQQTYRKE